VRRVLLVGAGEVGGKHLAALNHLAVVGIADPAPSTELPEGIPVFASWESALAKVSPELVVVAVPPGTALTVARAAAASGAAVLVEKPAVLDPAALTDADTDAGIFVAFQPHFAPGLDTLLSNPPDVERAEVSLAVRRDASYFRGWRRHFATAGGILHQQAVHGLALALRLLPGTVEKTEALMLHRRGLAEMEDRITATITLTGGRTLSIDARIDHDGPPHHELTLHCADGRRLDVRGRNLEAGLGDLTVTHEELRRRMYRAVLAAADGHPVHPCLFPLPALRRPLEVIDRVYRDAHVVRSTAV